MRKANVWLRNVDPDNLMFQAFHRHVLVSSGAVSTSGAQLSKWPVLFDYVQTTKATTGQKGIALLSGHSETRRPVMGKTNYNLVHITARSVRRMGVVPIEPQEIPDFLFKSLFKVLPDGVHVGVLAIDAMMITPSCQYDPTSNVLRGLVNTPSLESLAESYKGDPVLLRSHLSRVISAENLATNALQVILILPQFRDIPPLPIYYDLRRKWESAEDVIEFIRSVKKKLEVCENCYNDNQGYCEVIVPESGSSSLNPLRHEVPCEYCLSQGKPCKRLTIISACSDCEPTQARAAKIVNQDVRTNLYDFVMFPDPVHLLKSFKNSLINWVLFKDHRLLSFEALLAVMDAKSREARQAILFFERHIPALRSYIRSRDKHDPTQILDLAEATLDDEFMEDPILSTDVVSRVFPNPFKAITNPFAKSDDVIACAAIGNILLVLMRKHLFAVQLRRDVTPKEIPAAVPKRALDEAKEHFLGLFVIKDFLIVYSATNFFSLPSSEVRSVHLGTRKNYHWHKVNMVRALENYGTKGPLGLTTCACAKATTARLIIFATTQHLIFRGVLETPMIEMIDKKTKEPIYDRHGNIRKEIDAKQQPTLRFTNVPFKAYWDKTPFESKKMKIEEMACVDFQYFTEDDEHIPYIRIYGVVSQPTGKRMLCEFELYNSALPTGDCKGQSQAAQKFGHPLKFCLASGEHASHQFLLTAEKGIVKGTLQHNDSYAYNVYISKCIRDPTNDFLNYHSADGLVTCATIDRDVASVKCMTLIGESLVFIENGAIRICTSPVRLFELIQTIVPYIDVFQLWSASRHPDRKLVENAKHRGSDVASAIKIVDDIIKELDRWFLVSRAHAGLNEEDNILDEEPEDNVSHVPNLSDFPDVQDPTVDNELSFDLETAPAKVLQTDGARGTISSHLAAAFHRTCEGLVFLRQNNHDIPVDAISTLRLEHLFGTMREDPSASSYPTALQYTRVYSTSMRELLKKHFGPGFSHTTWIRERRYNQPVADESGLREILDWIPRKKRPNPIIDRASFCSGNEEIDEQNYIDAYRDRQDFIEALHDLLKINGAPIPQNRIRMFSRGRPGELPLQLWWKDYRDDPKRRKDLPSWQENRLRPGQDSDPDDVGDDSEQESLDLFTMMPTSKTLSTFNYNSTPVGRESPLVSLSVPYRSDSPVHSEPKISRVNSTSPISRVNATPVDPLPDKPKSRGRPKGSKNRDKPSERLTPNHQNPSRSAASSPTPSIPNSTSSTQSRRGRKPGGKNKDRAVSKVIYRNHDLVETSDGAVYQLLEFVYQKPKSKGFIPVAVKCKRLELQLHKPGDWLSRERWKLSDDTVSLKAKSIRHKRNDLRETTLPGEFITVSNVPLVSWGTPKPRKRLQEEEEADAESDDDDEEEDDDEDLGNDDED